MNTSINKIISGAEVSSGAIGVLTKRPESSSVDRLVNKIKKSGYPNPGVTSSTTAKEGIIFIPDISGFTQFVKQTDLQQGQYIIERLLNTIVSANQIGLEVSEIEGDAILFYKFNPLPSLSDLFKQFDVMVKQFQLTLIEMGLQFNQKINLALKAIIHYGSFSQFTISGFKKLYGQAVVEAHYLLKSHVSNHQYLLLTDELLQAMSNFNIDASSNWVAIKQCEPFEGLRRMCYSYIPYE